MNWIEVQSATMTRIGYDETSQILAVEFKNGTTYHYFDVPKHVFEQMKAASSKGSFLAQNIKGVYRYARA